MYIPPKNADMKDWRAPLLDRVMGRLVDWSLAGERWGERPSIVPGLSNATLLVFVVLGSCIALVDRIFG